MSVEMRESLVHKLCEALDREAFDALKRVTLSDEVTVNAVRMARILLANLQRTVRQPSGRPIDVDEEPRLCDDVQRLLCLAQRFGPGVGATSVSEEVGPSRIRAVCEESIFMEGDMRSDPPCPACREVGKLVGRDDRGRELSRAWPADVTSSSTIGTSSGPGRG